MNLDGGWSLKDRDPKTGRPQPNPKLFPSMSSGKLAKELNAK